LTYNRYIANQAHARSLSVGLKNDVGQLNQLVDNFDWALNEECFNYNECDAYAVFINNNKAVFNVEYDLNSESFCAEATQLGLSSMQKKWDLNGPSEVCWTKDWNSYCSRLDVCVCRKFTQSKVCAPLYDHYTSTAEQKATLKVNDDTIRAVGLFTVIGRIDGVPQHDTSRDIKIYSSTNTWVNPSASVMAYLRDRLYFKQKTVNTSSFLQKATTRNNPFTCGYKKWFRFPVTAGTTDSFFVVLLTIEC